MRKSHKVLIAVAVLLLVAALGGLIFYQRVVRKPETVLLLPEGDLLLYVNLKPAHLFGLGKTTTPPDDPEYQDFVKQTGFQFERDLDEVAMSQRAPGSDNTDSSEIFTGRFDQQRLTTYLQRLATSTERYADKLIYSIPHQGHTVRVVILGPRQAAVTNIGSADPMHSIIDKSRNSSLAGKGAYLLENYYGHVPLTSLAWLIYRTPANAAAPQLPGGLSFDFLQNTVTVGSLRYAGSVQLTAQIFAADEGAAANVADSINTFLALYRSVGQSVGARGTDPDVKAAMDSIQVRHEGDKAIVNATVPPGFVKKAISGAESTR
jgi:hypothetical protein